MNEDIIWDENLHEGLYRRIIDMRLDELCDFLNHIRPEQIEKSDFCAIWDERVLNKLKPEVKDYLSKLNCDDLINVINDLFDRWSVVL